MRNLIDVFTSVVVLGLLSACGGGNTGNTPPPSGETLIALTAMSGDQQHAFARGNLLFPIAVLAGGKLGPVRGVQVNFTAPTGVQVFPSTVTTGATGYARALVRMPDVPFSSFVITATARSFTAKFTEFTGPRLVDVFGNATAVNGAVAADGTFYAQGEGVIPTVGPGGTVFAPDGTVKAYLGSGMKKFSLPDAGGIYEGGRESIATAIGADQRIYFYNQGVVGIYVLDAQLNLVKFIDVGANNADGGPFDYDSLFTIAPNGNIFWLSYNGLVKAYDSNGVHIKDVAITPRDRWSEGIAYSNANNFVTLANNDSLTGAVVTEYTLQGDVVRASTIDSRGVGLARDTAGNYAVLTCCLPSPTVIWLDQNLHETKRTALDLSSGNVAGGFYVDDGGNVYLQGASSVMKFNSAGNVAWITPGFPGSFSGIHMNGAGGSALAVDPLRGAAYFQFLDKINVFSHQLYSGQFPVPGASIAIDSGGKLYSVNSSTVIVLNQSGTVLNTLDFSQIHSAKSIAISSDDTKYVLDLSPPSIHKIDNFDHYVGSIPINLPAGVMGNCGTLAPSPDGNLVLGIGGSTLSPFSCDTMFVRKVGQDGIEIWNHQASTPLTVTVDSAGRIFVLKPAVLEVWNPSGTLLGQVDLTIAADPLFNAPRAIATVGDQVYFHFAGRVYVVAGQ